MNADVLEKLLDYIDSRISEITRPESVRFYEQQTQKLKAELHRMAWENQESRIHELEQTVAALAVIARDSGYAI